MTRGKDKLILLSRLCHRGTRKKYGNLDRKFSELKAKLKEVFQPYSSQAPSSLDSWSQLLLYTLLHKQEITWKQKAHDTQILMGDRNTKLFHNKVQKWKWRSRIHSIMDSAGNIITDESLMANQFLESWKANM